MAKRKTPQWQPISQLPLLATAIDGMLESGEENNKTLQKARPTPWVLDDRTVNRVIEVYTAQQDDLWAYDEQIRRWGEQELSAQQRKEVDRLAGQVKRLRQVITANLELAGELKKGAIEKMMGNDDAQLGLEFLLRSLGHARDDE